MNRRTSPACGIFQLGIYPYDPVEARQRGGDLGEPEPGFTGPECGVFAGAPVRRALGATPGKIIPWVKLVSERGTWTPK